MKARDGIAARQTGTCAASGTAYRGGALQERATNGPCPVPTAATSEADQPRISDSNFGRPGRPVTALRVGGGAFLALADRSPAFRAAVTRCLLAKMRASDERRAAERVWDAKERLAQVLYDLGEKCAQPGSDGLIRIPITQSELGDLAGVAVSTAERVLKDLRRQGAVSTRYREIAIRDMANLDRNRFSRESLQIYER